MSAIAYKIKTRYPQLGIVFLVFIAFIALGMPDGLLGIAWPSIRESFSVPLDSIAFLLTTNVTGYLISSFMSGPLVARFGVGKVLAMSCALTGAGLIGYILVPVYWMMIALGLAAGLGAGAIDSSLNSYVASNFSERLMQWMHASYGVGITLGPIIMTASLTTFDSWRIGYLIVGGFQLILTLCFITTLPQWNKNNRSSSTNEEHKKPAEYKTPMGKTLLQPKALLSGLLFFVYTGCESGLGTWAYTLLVQSRGIDPESAGLCVGSYWASFTVGRIIAGLYAKRAGINAMVFSSLIIASLGSILLWWNPADITNLIAVVFIGVAIAPVFPAMISGTIQRVGSEFASNTIGIEMACASLGVGILPSTMGILARNFSLEIIPVYLLFLFIVLFSLYILAVKISKPLSNPSVQNPA